MQADAQVRRVLDVERQQRAGEQDEPSQVCPQQRADDRDEARIDERDARRDHHQGGEHAANRRPDHARRERANERRLPPHARVRHEHVHDHEERGHHRVRRNLHAPLRELLQERDFVFRVGDRPAKRGVRKAEEADEQNRPHDEQAQVLRDPPRPAAWLFDAPEEVEAVLDLLDRVEQRPDEQRKADRPHDAAADVVRKFHDALGDVVRAGLTHRLEEFEDDRLELTVCAETLQHRKGEGDERHDRQERRIHEPHRTQVDVAMREVAGHGIGITQDAQEHRRRAGSDGSGAEQQPVQKAPELQPHRVMIPSAAA